MEQVKKTLALAALVWAAAVSGTAAQDRPASTTPDRPAATAPDRPAAAAPDRPAATGGGDQAAGRAASSPDAAGLGRASAGWPSWLDVGFLYRGRVESVRPAAGASSDYDGYYLNRLRLSAAVRARKWLQVVTQIQDAEAMGYQASPAPRGMAGGFDLRQGYVEVGRRGPRGLVVAGGRQELSFGDGRLLASPDWGNSSRTYDLGRVSGSLPGVKVDVLRAAPVDIDPGKFDRAKPGEYFWAAYASLTRVPRLAVLDLYFVQKATSVATGEQGSAGDGRVYTYGGRAVAPLGRGVTADFEGALQRGHLAADSVTAWAVHGGLAWEVASRPGRPRLVAEYNRASGDRDPKDGTRQTFDQLYASNHAKYGLADLVGWRNMQSVQARVELSPARRLKVTGAIARLGLVSGADAWYGSSGSKTASNPAATSRDIGWEPDAWATYAVSKELTLAAGLALLLPGDYVRQTTSLDRYWYPYAACTLKF